MASSKGPMGRFMESLMRNPHMTNAEAMGPSSAGVAAAPVSPQEKAKEAAAAMAALRAGAGAHSHASAMGAMGVGGVAPAGSGNSILQAVQRVNGVNSAEMSEVGLGQCELQVLVAPSYSTSDVAHELRDVLEAVRPIAVQICVTVSNGGKASDYRFYSPPISESTARPKAIIPGVEITTEPNMSLEARVRRKVKEQYGEDDDNPDDDSGVVLDLPKGVIGNTLNGESVQKYRKELENKWVYEVRFNLNGVAYKVETDVTNQFLETAGNNNTFVATLADGVGKAITQSLLEKLLKATQ